MQLKLEGTPKEIADLVLAVQGQQKEETKAVETCLYPTELLRESISSVLRERNRDTNEEKSS